MAFRPLQSLLEQQNSLVAGTQTGQKISPSGSQQTNFVEAPKPSQKFQLPGGQIITVSNLQNENSFSIQANSPMFKSKKLGPSGTYAKRLLMKQQQQQQQNQISQLQSQHQDQLIHVPTSSIVTSLPFQHESIQLSKPVTFQLNGETQSLDKGNLQIVYQNSLERNLSTPETEESIIIEGFEEQVGHVIYHGDFATDQPGIQQSSLNVSNGSIFTIEDGSETIVPHGSQGFDVSGFENDIGEPMEVSEPADIKLHDVASVTPALPQKETTTVLIPSATPGGEPQRLVIPTSTLMQITGSEQRHPDPLPTPEPKPTFDCFNTPTKNNSSFIVVQNSSFEEVQQKPKGIRFVPITAAPTCTDHVVSKEFESNGPLSPSREYSQCLTSAPDIASACSEPSRSRKPCNCTKSQCLKLYCDCFANGEFCFACNCHNCFNNLEHEEIRQRAIKQCLDRNPMAFRPKIGKNKANGNETRRHAKGCNCKKSGCLKNYCECYEAKIPCTKHCKCVGCKNSDDNDGPEEDKKPNIVCTSYGVKDSIKEEAIPASKFQKAKTPEGPFSSVPCKPSHYTDTGQRQPFSLITQDLVEAATTCMLSACFKVESSVTAATPPSSSDTSKDLAPSQIGTDADTEAVAIEEFGRCLMQIINASQKTP